MTHPVVNDCPGEGGAEDARYGPHGVGDPHQDGGVLRSHVQVIHPKSAPQSVINLTVKKNLEERNVISFHNKTALKGPSGKIRMD